MWDNYDDANKDDDVVYDDGDDDDDDIGEVIAI